MRRSVFSAVLAARGTVIAAKRVESLERLIVHDVEMLLQLMPRHVDVSDLAMPHASAFTPQLKVHEIGARHAAVDWLHQRVVVPTKGLEKRWLKSAPG